MTNLFADKPLLKIVLVFGAAAILVHTYSAFMDKALADVRAANADELTATATQRLADAEERVAEAQEATLVLLAQVHSNKSAKIVPMPTPRHGKPDSEPMSYGVSAPKSITPVPVPLLNNGEVWSLPCYDADIQHRRVRS